VRNTVSFGLDALDATDNQGPTPDGQFIAWLGQFQWAHRVPFFDRAAQLIARADIQLTDSPLLGLEQFALGGHATVRGYRENELVRDNGFIGSFEARLPVFTRSTGAPILELAPFVDFGRSWSKSRPTDGPKVLASMGVGARWAVTEAIHAQAYWGDDLTNVDREGESDLQDSGLHFSISASLP
jgi:hemolysin activation/secretion protein